MHTQEVTQTQLNPFFQEEKGRGINTKEKQHSFTSESGSLAQDVIH